jgi:hypothetical protein
MNEKAKQLPGARGGKARRLRHWFRTLLTVLDDIMAVTLESFWAAGSGLAAARAGKAPERRP